MAEDYRRTGETEASAGKAASEVREDIVRSILEQQPDDEILYDLAELFKV